MKETSSIREDETIRRIQELRDSLHAMRLSLEHF